MNNSLGEEIIGYMINYAKGARQGTGLDNDCSCAQLASLGVTAPDNQPVYRRQTTTDKQ